MIRIRLFHASPLALVALLCASPLLLNAQEPAAPAQKEQQDLGRTPLQQQMYKVRGELRKLRRSLRDEDKGTALTDVIALQHAMKDARLHRPSRADTMVVDEERRQYVNEFRKQLIKLESKALELEVALLDRDYGEARDLYEELLSIQEEGHEKFAPDVAKNLEDE